MSMSTRTLGADTGLQDIYPTYVNFTLEGGDTVVITVRGWAVAHESKKFQVPGPTVEHRMALTKFKQMIGATVVNLIVADADARSMLLKLGSLGSAVADPPLGA